MPTTHGGLHVHHAADATPALPPRSSRRASSPPWPPAAPTTAGGGGGDGDADSITSGSRRTCPTGSPPPRTIVDAFTEKTGIEVELTAVAEDQFNQILTSNAAAGDLPDVMGGIPLGQIRTLSANELIDTDAVGDVIDDLDAGTFSESALELTADGDTQLGGPERVVGPAARLPQGPLRRGRAGRPGDVRRRPRGRRGAGQPRHGRLRRRQRRRRRVHRADLRGDRPRQRLRAGRRRRARSPSTATECVEALDFYGQLHAELLGRPVRRTSTPRARRTSPGRPR